MYRNCSTNCLHTLRKECDGNENCQKQFLFIYEDFRDCLNVTDKMGTCEALLSYS